MAQIQRRRGRIQLRLDERERTALLGIVEELSPRIGQTLATTPRAYDAAGPQAEYDRWVRPEIERGREADLEIVRDALSSDENLSILTDAAAYAWIRALNHLRLAAGGVLGIEEDGWEGEASEEVRNRREFGMLIALGWLQEELVTALET